MKKNNNIRIKDIAKMAGVSAGTVDRVIHDRGNVSVEVEKKIKTLIRETNYSPNPLAQSLGSQEYCRIAVLLPHPEQDEYWQLSNEGMNRAIGKWEPYHIHIQPHTFNLDRPDSFSRVTEQVLRNKPDAVLSAPIFYEESLLFFKELQSAKIPYVLVNTRINKAMKKYNPLCFIGQDHHQSGRLAAELMHITLPQPEHVAVMHIHENVERSIHLREKEEGFRSYFDELNPGGFKVSTFSFLDEKDSFSHQIENCIINTNIKGIFVPTSTGAFLTAKALQKQHKENMVLVGYDLLQQNIQFLSKGVINFLINQKPRHQAFQGLRYLVDHLLLNMDIPPSYLLPLQIVTRQNYTSFLVDPS